MLHPTGERSKTLKQRAGNFASQVPDHKINQGTSNLLFNGMKNWSITCILIVWLPNHSEDRVSLIQLFANWWLLISLIFKFTCCMLLNNGMLNLTGMLTTCSSTHNLKKNTQVVRSSALDSDVLVLSECGFESRPGRSRRLCPWARHLTIIALSFRWDVKL